MEEDLIKTMEVIPLHHMPHLIDQTCNLLNLEWKRSEVARLRGLTVSCDELPTCLVLIKTENNIPVVIGHSKLSRIPTVPEGCFVESVVIHPSYRRKGLGKYLMCKTEDYAKSRGFTWIYLSTHDQEIFYGKLGYNFCQPVSIYGSAIPNKGEKGSGSVRSEDLKSKIASNAKESSTSNPPPKLPPLPPPMPMNTKLNVRIKVFMNKELL